MSAPVELATEPVRISIHPSRKAGELAFGFLKSGRTNFAHPMVKEDAVHAGEGQLLLS